MNTYAKELRECTYSITSITHKKAPVFSDFHLARELVRSIRLSDNEQATKTVGFVVMPTHFHWLFKLGYIYNLNNTVERVKGRAALAVNKQRNGIHKIWQVGFQERCIQREEELIKAMRHIVRSPLRAGLVNSLKLYPHWDCVYL
jgi:REP element-mobilizing transposase RayT